jgi:ATP-dependent RNA helicase CshB
MYFSQLNIQYWIKSICNQLKYNELTKIQELTIPQLLKDTSAIISSQTGSGKTLCYLIPILNKIVFENTTQVLIVLPTKELARQIYSKLLQFKQIKNELKIGLAVGGGNYEDNKFNFKKNPPHIIVGTISKVLEIVNKKFIDRAKINTLVVDEADMLMEQGFSGDTNTLFNFIDKPTLQKIACSATTHESLANQLSKYFKNTKVFSLSKTI